MSDQTNDMLNIIRNGYLVLRPSVDVAFSNLNYEILKILEKNDFIEKTEKKGKKMRKFIEVVLKYQEKNDQGVKPIKIPAISGIKRISRPGQKIYVQASKIKRVRSGYGISIISTPKGLLTGSEARRQKAGGELICEVW